MAYPMEAKRRMCLVHDSRSMERSSWNDVGAIALDGRFAFDHRFASPAQHARLVGQFTHLAVFPAPR